MIISKKTIREKARACALAALERTITDDVDRPDGPKLVYPENPDAQAEYEKAYRLALIGKEPALEA